MKGQEITSITDFISAVEHDYAEWQTPQRPWFRGEPDPDHKDVTPLLPKLFRTKHDENSLLQFFRMRAPVLDLPIVPDRGEIDKWTFLARHVGLPTRLLDWTEGALIALYFALQEKAADDSNSPVVWMLNPYVLNQQSAEDATPNSPTITWAPVAKRAINVILKDLTDSPALACVPGEEKVINVAFENFRRAWTGADCGTKFPVAIYPTVIHPLMSAQHSCFTIHGRRDEGLWALSEEIEGDCLRRYEIRINKYEGLSHLRRLGISQAALFPSAQGLAEELEWLYTDL